MIFGTASFFALNITTLLRQEMNTSNKIAIIQSAWHRDIVAQLTDSFKKEFNKLSNAQIDVFEVPGAFEIPLHAKKLALSGNYSGVVAAGLVVNGGIYRHDFVASSVIDGLMQTQLDTGVPIFSAVLTPHHFHNSEEHSAFFAEHFVVKGQEVAQACADTLRSFASIAQSKAA